MILNNLSTQEVPVPETLIDQIIGQKKAVEVVRLAARQRRFLLIVGEPGTGKSMLGRALADLMNAEPLEDLIAFANPDDPSQPHVTSVPQGEGQTRVNEAKQRLRGRRASSQFIITVALVATIIVTAVQVFRTDNYGYILGGLFIGIFLFLLKSWTTKQSNQEIPKVLIHHKEKNHVPFVDATGLHEGGLFGDVRHDPYQSGGAESPHHTLIEAGAIHRAHKGVLFIDEMATLSTQSQQNLLTAIQQKELSITGRSAGSSGTMVRTAPVPCDFTLVLAGNEEDLNHLHPALRSRVQGFGYEIYTKPLIDDNDMNIKAITQFVAQEVNRDGKIPHFDPTGIQAIVEESRRRAGQPRFLSARFRELGGLVRAAGDLAVKESKSLVDQDTVLRALPLVRSLEDQRYHATADQLQSQQSSSVD